SLASRTSSSSKRCGACGSSSVIAGPRHTTSSRRSERGVQFAFSRGMHILVTLVVGLIVGAIAKLLMPGRDPGGVIVTILLGIGGSLVAGWVGRAIGLYRDPASGPGIIASIIGAMAILAIYRVVIGRRRLGTRGV